MPDLVSSDLEWALALHAAHQPRYRLFRQYYDGEHRLAFATEKFRNSFGDLFSAFALNMCAAVVDAPADRMQLTGWGSVTAADATTAGPSLADRASAEWTRARMASRIGTVFTTSFQQGDGFLIPGRNPAGRWFLHPQPAEAMVVDYHDDDPETLARSAKVWRRPDRRWRVNVYRPEGITRWVSREKSDDRPGPGRFMEAQDEVGGAAPSPIPGQVAVLHFPNNPGTGSLGRSQLVDAIPLQDALNKTVADMLVASEFVALPQRAFLNVDDDIDPVTGQNRPLFMGPNRVVRIKPNGAGQQAPTVTQFPGADLSAFLTVADMFRLDIARVTGTPPQYLQLGSFSQLAGAALRVLETRFTRFIGDRRVDFTPELARAAAWLMFLNTSGSLEAAEQLEPTWDPAEAPAELEDLQVAEGIVRLGGSKAEALRRMRYTDEKIAAMRDEARDEPQALAGALMAGFDAGV